MGKKKATGMSKRLGFTDRQTIAENKDILRYNERLEREATGASAPDRSARRSPRAGADRPARSDRGAAGTRPSADSRGPSRAARPPRPVRPPGLDDEQLTTLRSAYQAVVGESGLEPAAEKVLDRLVAHDSFERASMAGWELAGGAHAEERNDEQWALLRKAWLGVRLALLEGYAVIKPELAPALDRERKQQARLDRPARPRQRPATGAKGRQRRPKSPAKTGGDGEGTPRAPRMPSPADLARRAGGAQAPGDGASPTTAADDATSLPVEPTDVVSASENVDSGVAADQTVTIDSAAAEATPDLTNTPDVAAAEAPAEDAVDGSFTAPTTDAAAQPGQAEVPVEPLSDSAPEPEETVVELEADALAHEEDAARTLAPAVDDVTAPVTDPVTATPDSTGDSTTEPTTTSVTDESASEGDSPELVDGQVPGDIGGPAAGVDLVQAAPTLEHSEPSQPDEFTADAEPVAGEPVTASGDAVAETSGEDGAAPDKDQLTLDF